MNKLCLPAVLFFLLCSGGMAGARIDDSRIAMGGIAIGSTEAYLRQTYGTPKSMVRTWYAPYSQYVREYNYGDSFFVTALEKTGMIFRMQSLTKRNGIYTKDGITIGSSLPDVLRLYGKPDLRQIDGESDYLWYLGSGKKGNIVFQVSYGKVTGITCGGRRIAL